MATSGHNTSMSCDQETDQSNTDIPAKVTKVEEKTCSNYLDIAMVRDSNTKPAAKKKLCRLTQNLTRTSLELYSNQCHSLSDSELEISSSMTSEFLDLPRRLSTRSNSPLLFCLDPKKLYLDLKQDHQKAMCNVGARERSNTEPPSVKVSNIEVIVDDIDNDSPQVTNNMYLDNYKTYTENEFVSRGSGVWINLEPQNHTLLSPRSSNGSICSFRSSNADSAIEILTPDEELPEQPLADTSAAAEYNKLWETQQRHHSEDLNITSSYVESSKSSCDTFHSKSSCDTFQSKSSCDSFPSASSHDMFQSKSSCDSFQSKSSCDIFQAKSCDTIDSKSSCDTFHPNPAMSVSLLPFPTQCSSSALFTPTSIPSISSTHNSSTPMTQQLYATSLGSIQGASMESSQGTSLSSSLKDSALLESSFGTSLLESTQGISLLESTFETSGFKSIQGEQPAIQTPAVVISDFSSKSVHDKESQTIQTDLENEYNSDLLGHKVLYRRSFSNSSISSESSLSMFSDSSDVADLTDFPIKLKPKQSSWKKIRNMVHWSPFIQQFKRRRYPWIQLAGHQGNFQAGEAGAILKKYDKREHQSFNKLMNDVLRPYVPEYRGEVEKNEDRYLQLQDLLCEFDAPCVMDIKMGCRTYLEEELTKAREKPTLRKDMYQKMVEVDPTAPTDEENEQKAITKPRYMQWRDDMSSSVNMGFRIEGIRKSDGAQVKNFKTTKDKASVKKCLKQFVEENPQIINKYLSRLKAIRVTQESSPFFQSHEIIGSSLLFVHDRCGQASIWMIDFGKTVPLPDNTKVTHRRTWEEGNHEDGYLMGIDSLIVIFEELRNEFKLPGYEQNETSNTFCPDCESSEVIDTANKTTNENRDNQSDNININTALNEAFTDSQGNTNSSSCDNSDTRGNNTTNNATNNTTSASEC